MEHKHIPYDPAISLLSISLAETYTCVFKKAYKNIHSSIIVKSITLKSTPMTPFFWCLTTDSFYDSPLLPLTVPYIWESWQENMGSSFLAKTRDWNHTNPSSMRTVIPAPHPRKINPQVTLLSLISSHFWTAWEACPARPWTLNYLSSKPFYTFLVCVCGVPILRHLN